MYWILLTKGIVIILILVTSIFILNKRNKKRFESLLSLLAANINDITFSLLSIPDDETLQFDNYLVEGFSKMSKVSNSHAVGVFKNQESGNGLKIVTELFWDGEIINDKKSITYDYEQLPGWYEDLSNGRVISKTISELSEHEKHLKTPKALTILVVPVEFQQDFWGFLVYEDHQNEKHFDTKRIAILKSSALMIVSAVHRRNQSLLIRETTIRMRIMLDAMPVCCFVFDWSGKLIDVNRLGVDFFGFINPDDAMKRYYDASPEFQSNGRQSKELLREYIGKTLNEGHIELEWIHMNPETGELIPCEVTLVRMNYGREFVVAGYLRDVREHRNMIHEIEHRGHLLYTVNSAANILLQSEIDQFETALFRSLSMMARAVDVERIFVWEYLQNEKARFFNQTYEWVGDATIFGRQNKKIDPPEGMGGMESRLFRGLAVSGMTGNLSEEIKTSLGFASTLSYLMIPVFLRGKLWGLLGFGDMRNERDFSESDESILRSGGLLVANALLRNEMTQKIIDEAVESVKLQKQLEIALVNAQAASQAKSNFLSTMSHEMRTPMNAIIGMTAIGYNAVEVERKDYAFERIDAASNHLLGVINDVLDMSKIEAGMLSVSDEVFDIDNVIYKVLDVINFRVDEKNQEIRTTIDPAVPQYLVADDQRLSQVLTNLLSNAVKFTPNNKIIKLEAYLLEIEETCCKLMFSVIDQGIGLSKEQQSVLFESFVQAETSTSRKYGGTGLGLSISKHIVEQMGGEIWIESELGMGAAFSFTINAKIPGKDELDAMNMKVNSSDELMTFPGRRIILAEDVDINREILIAMLEDTKIRIDTVENGEEAVRLFESNPEAYDLIFMDVHMPIMDGYQATRAIRKLHHPYAKTVPIVAMTANVFREDVEKCLAAGMNDHIGKPLDPKDVRDSLRKYLAPLTPPPPPPPPTPPPPP